MLGRDAGPTFVREAWPMPIQIALPSDPAPYRRWDFSCDVDDFQRELRHQRDSVFCWCCGVALEATAA